MFQTVRPGGHESMWHVAHHHDVTLVAVNYGHGQATTSTPQTQVAMPLGHHRIVQAHVTQPLSPGTRYTTQSTHHGTFHYRLKHETRPRTPNLRCLRFPRQNRTSFRRHTFQVSPLETRKSHPAYARAHSPAAGDRGLVTLGWRSFSRPCPFPARLAPPDLARPCLARAHPCPARLPFSLRVFYQLVDFDHGVHIEHSL